MTYLEDIESDLSVFHRIDDWRVMGALRFVSLSERLFHYRGAIRDIALMERAESGQSEEISSAPPPHDESSGLPPAIEVRKASAV